MILKKKEQRNEEEEEEDEKEEKYKLAVPPNGLQSTALVSNQKQIFHDEVDPEPYDEMLWTDRDPDHAIKRGHKKFVLVSHGALGFTRPRRPRKREADVFFDNSTKIEHAGLMAEGSHVAFVVTLHGGYITKRDKYDGKIEGETTVYQNNRLITHLAPLGTSSRIGGSMDTLMMQMIFTPFLISNAH